MTPIGWRIYFGDGSVLSSLAGSWREAPATDVQAVVVFYSETYEYFDEEKVRQSASYRLMLHSEEYYWLEGITPNAGTARQAQAQAVEGSVKAGGLLTKELFRSIYNTARGDLKW